MPHHHCSPGQCNKGQEWSRTNLPAQNRGYGLEKDVGDEEDQHDDVLESELAGRRTERSAVEIAAHIAITDSELQLL